MTIHDIKGLLDSWAHPSLAWEKDNVGLELGAMNKRVRGILVALDVTDAVIEEARAQKIDVIISHHPMFFRPLRSINTGERTGRMVSALLRSGIAVFTAHTNLDVATGGVSSALAQALELQGPAVLSPEQHRRQKIVTFVPREHADTLRAAMALEGAGVIGAYTNCSYMSDGMGTFLPGAAARPFVGAGGRLEQAEELRLEMVADDWNVERVIGALRAAHPYEEPAYDIYRIENASASVGAGAIGALKRPMRLKQFLTRVRLRLKVPALRYCGDLQSLIRTVAVCGGSGSEYMAAAMARGADAFVTSDIRYHAFQEPDGRMALIDAGHYETELPAVAAVARYLRQNDKVRKEHIRIVVSRASKNSVQYFSS